MCRVGHGRGMKSRTAVKDQGAQALNTWSAAALQPVAASVAFLRCRARVVPPLVLAAAQLVTRYAAFADADRALAAEGVEEYRVQLHDEDAQ